MNNKILKGLLFLIVLIIPIGYGISYEEATFSQFTGTHDAGGCHATSTITKSTNGFCNITTDAINNTIEGGNSFTIYVDVINFTEASSFSVVLGFRSSTIDNDEFSFNPVQKDTVTLDAGGNSTSSASFTATAPSTSTEINYTLQVDAIDGGQGSGSTAFLWAEGNITITVTKGETTDNGNGDPTPAPFDIFVIIYVAGTVAGIVLLVFVLVKVSKPKRFL